MPEQQILARLQELGIEELKAIRSLNVLKGSFVNNECRLPNGTRDKILDDGATYLCAQVEIESSDRCYGVAADDHQIAVFSYGCEGTDCELEVWTKIGR